MREDRGEETRTPVEEFAGGRCKLTLILLKELGFGQTDLKPVCSCPGIACPDERANGSAGGEHNGVSVMQGFVSASVRDVIFKEE